MEYAENYIKVRRSSIYAATERTFTNGRFVYQYYNFDQMITVLDTFNGVQISLVASSVLDHPPKFVGLLDMFVLTPSHLIVCWCGPSAEYFVGQIHLDFDRRLFELQFTQIIKMNESSYEDSEHHLCPMNEQKDRFLLVLPQIADNLHLFEYDVQQSTVHELGVAEVEGYRFTGFQVFNERVYFFDSLTASQCRYAHYYDLNTKTTHEIDFGPMACENDPSDELNIFGFSRRNFCIGNGSYVMLLRTRVYDGFLPTIYENEDDYVEDYWDDRLSPVSRLFHLDLRDGKWREVKAPALLSMPELMMFETWDMIHFDSSDGVLTIHSRMDWQSTTMDELKSNCYDERFLLRSSRLPLRFVLPELSDSGSTTFSKPDSLVNLSWFKLTNIPGLKMYVPRTLSVQPLFDDDHRLNHVQFTNKRKTATVNAKRKPNQLR